MASDGAGVITYSGSDPTYQTYLAASDLKDVHINSVTNSGSSNGFIVFIPMKLNGNASYVYTLTLPIVNTSGANNLSITAWDGAGYNIDLIQGVYNFTTGYSKLTFTFNQIAASTTTLLFTKTVIGGSTFNLAAANTVTLNAGNLEIYITVNQATSDLRSSYYVLSLSKLIHTNTY